MCRHDGVTDPSRRQQIDTTLLKKEEEEEEEASIKFFDERLYCLFSEGIIRLLHY